MPEALQSYLIEHIPIASLPPGSTADVWLISAKVNDISGYAEQLITLLTDTSWIKELGAVGRMTFEATAKRTIGKLVSDFKEIENTVTTSFGEYMVSMAGGQSVGLLLDHAVFPISELWKEKLTNNHGFDFHTESKCNRISFGEAKYSATANPYRNAASQVIEFIALEKDKGDASNLQHFATPRGIDNLSKGKRGFTLAFSVNSDDPEPIIRNAFASELVQKLCAQCDHLQIVGVSS